jgi:hypothetical protein
MALRAVKRLACLVAIVSMTVCTAGSVAAQDAPPLPDFGQPLDKVWVAETGHTLQSTMLDYWRANGAAATYGNPISEPFAGETGTYSQAFENGILEYVPDLLLTTTPWFRLAPLGSFALEERVDEFRRDGRRDFGGGNRDIRSWVAYGSESRVAARAYEEGGLYNEVTGHSITREMLAWYQNHEGEYYLGNPLSQPVRERGLTVQYFEGGILLRDSAGAVRLAPLGREFAKRLGIQTLKVEQGDLPVYDESAFIRSYNPNPMGDLSTPGRKWIEVNVSEQAIYAYQGNTMISSSLVSTGLSPNDTELGVFRVRLKFEAQDMAGFTSASGEVISLGTEQEEGAEEGEAYAVDDVPNVLYFNMDAEALHGAYWHNNFGNRMSHGCVNLPLDFAAFLWGWAPVGTMVWVHE